MVRRTALCATVFGAFGGLALIGLAGCDSHPAAIPARIEAAEAQIPVRAEPAAFTTASAPPRRAERAQAADERAPAPLFRGKPMWADNRNHTAEENARYQFEQHGEELGARSLEDFLGKAHGFVSRPPEGALVKTRANGDKLMYDPASGLFAVARSDGAPRTVFKPNDGEAYWRAQDTGERRTQASRRAAGRDEG